MHQDYVPIYVETVDLYSLKHMYNYKVHERNSGRNRWTELVLHAL
jgi:hypothetical protein